MVWSDWKYALRFLVMHLANINYDWHAYSEQILLRIQTEIHNHVSYTYYLADVATWVTKDLILCKPWERPGNPAGALPKQELQDLGLPCSYTPEHTTVISVAAQYTLFL